MRDVFSVASFVVLLVAETVMVCGGAGAGYQVLYFQVTFQPHRLMMSHLSIASAAFFPKIQRFAE